MFPFSLSSVRDCHFMQYWNSPFQVVWSIPNLRVYCNCWLIQEKFCNWIMLLKSLAPVVSLLLHQLSVIFPNAFMLPIAIPPRSLRSWLVVRVGFQLARGLLLRSKSIPFRISVWSLIFALFEAAAGSIPLPVLVCLEIEWCGNHYSNHHMFRSLTR